MYLHMEVCQVQETSKCLLECGGHFPLSVYAHHSVHADGMDFSLGITCQASSALISKCDLVSDVALSS